MKNWQLVDCKYSKKKPFFLHFYLTYNCNFKHAKSPTYGLQKAKVGNTEVQGLLKAHSKGQALFFHLTMNQECRY